MDETGKLRTKLFVPVTSRKQDWEMEEKHFTFHFQHLSVV